MAQVEACSRKLQNADHYPESSDPPSTISTSSPGTSLALVTVENNEYLIGINPIILSEHMVNLNMDLSTSMSHINWSGVTHCGKTPDFYMYRHFRSPQRLTFFLELSQQEPGTRLFWKNRNKKSLTLETIKGFESPSMREELAAATKARFGEKYIPSIQEAKSLRLDLNQIHRHFSDYGQYCGLSYDIVPSDSILLETLTTILPDRFSILGYVRRFFDVIYPVYPILDESWVNFQITNIFRFSNDGNLEHVSITSHQDQLVLGIILLILRMSFISFFKNIVSMNANVLQSTKPPFPARLPLKDCQISLSAVSIASNLIERGSKDQKVLLLILQARLMLCILQMCASESEMGFSALRTSLNHAQLIQMAYSLTMERDPSYVADFQKPNERACNLKRKIWYVLVRLDFIMAYLYKSPQIIDPVQYNTMLPQFSPSSSNIEDLALEKEVCSLMSQVYQIMNSGTPLLKMIQNTVSVFKASDCLQELTEFEMRIQKDLGTPVDYLQGQKQFKYACKMLLTLDMQTQIILKMFTGQIYYFFYLYFKYQENLDLEFFFLRKSLSIMFLEMNIYRLELMFLETALVNSSFFFHMNPILITYTNSISLIGMGICIRLKCSLLLAQNSQSSAQLIRSLEKLVSQSESFVFRKLKISKVLSERYFKAWKCVKSFGHGCKLLYSPELFGDNLELENASFKWSNHQQEQMLKLVTDEIQILQDVGDIGEYCYYSDKSMQDRLLKGDDLLKTIQTDNFWICMNSLAENDPANFPSKFELDMSMTSGNASSSFADSGVVEDTNYPTTGAADAVQQSFSRLVMNRGQVMGNFGDENVNQIIDFNMFNSDWSIDDFFQGPM